MQLTFFLLHSKWFTMPSTMSAPEKQFLTSFTLTNLSWIGSRCRSSLTTPTMHGVLGFLLAAGQLGLSSNPYTGTRGAESGHHRRARSCTRRSNSPLLRGELSTTSPPTSR